MKQLLLYLIFLLISISGNAQVLNLPNRPVNALNGSQFVSLVTSMSLTDRENEIFSQVMSGNVPEFMRTLIPVTVTQTISSVSYTLTYYAIPDYLAIGCDSNYFLCPMTPLLAQKICDYTNCTLPTRKMVNAIWSAATVKLSPSSIPPSGLMVTVPIFDQHNTTVWGQRSAVLAAHPLGELVGGDKKDVVISNIIYGNPSPGRVVIYGWHYTSGTAIQPLYAGHEETYADYSHGIRLVQMNCTLNGSATTVNSILTSSTLNALLSDEGVIAVPRYPVAVAQAVVPASFCVLNNGSGSVRIKVKDYPENTGCIVMHSTDGVNFSQLPGIYNDTNIVLTNLSNQIIHYFKIAGTNNFDTSAYSQVLAAVPSLYAPRVLIANAFDRATTGNTYNFILQHGKSVFACGYLFNSATNEALTDNLLPINNYAIVDYILGEESTVDETFNATEQTLMANYLDQGGKLFLSGAEIAWDLDNKGSTTDKSFINNYLKAQYVNDAPNGLSATYYSASPLASQFFNSLSAISFDNGTHGTYNVKYPDVLNGVNGGVNAFYYTTLSTNYAGICYSGLFPSGTVPGKIVFIGIPFETFYPESQRYTLMQKVLEYLEPHTAETISASGPLEFCQNDSVCLSVPNDFAYSYQWKRNGNILSGDTLNLLMVHQSGTYELVLNHNAQQIMAQAVQVTVKPLPVAAITTPDNQIFCSGDSAVLSTPAASNYNYQWMQNAGVIGGALSNTLTATQSANYAVVVSHDGCSATDTILITVNPLPPVPVITQNGSDLSASAASGYQWSDTNGAISGETAQSFTPLQSGIYYVQVSNANNCYAMSAGFNYVITGISENAFLPCLLGYSENDFTINVNTRCNYKISDLLGRTIQTGQLLKGTNTAGFSCKMGGMYLLTLNLDDRVQTFKIAINQ